MKELILKYFPFVKYLGSFISFQKHMIKYLKYSSVVSLNNEMKLMSRIVADYHVIEKGLTMPETRPGFGKLRLLELIRDCVEFINLYGKTNTQFKYAVGVINEYLKFHEEINFYLDSDIIAKTKHLNTLVGEEYYTKQKQLTASDYFEHTSGTFDEFSSSRLSVRNYSNRNIDIETIKLAVNLAKNAPSSCNRQTTKVNIVTDKEVMKKVLEIQGGNRGFGHLSNKLIIVTSDLSGWHGVNEMNAPYVDGGIFVMNLLYSLHFHKIAACPLNCNFSPQKDKAIRKLIQIPKSEIFITMISCGYVNGEFKVPASNRYNINDITRIV